MDDGLLDENDPSIVRACVNLGRPDLLIHSMLNFNHGLDSPDQDLLIHAISTPNLPNKDTIVTILLGTFVETQSLDQLLEVSERLDYGNIPSIMEYNEHQKFKDILAIYTYNT